MNLLFLTILALALDNVQAQCCPTAIFQTVFNCFCQNQCSQPFCKNQSLYCTCFNPNYRPNYGYIAESLKSRSETRGYTGPLSPSNRFEMSDHNGDGALSQREFDAWAKYIAASDGKWYRKLRDGFKQMDKNRDGFVLRNEVGVDWV